LIGVRRVVQVNFSGLAGYLLAERGAARECQKAERRVRPRLSFCCPTLQMVWRPPPAVFRSSLGVSFTGACHFNELVVSLS
jgi:hypothetical protein